MRDRTLPIHAPAPHPPGPDPRRWWALVLLCLAQFMVILDITVVNVALPSIGTDLDLDRASLTWVVTAYTLCFGGFMLLGGRLVDALGRRRIFLAGLGLFTVASLASGLSQTGAVLIAARGGQGVGAALLSPAALSISSPPPSRAASGTALWGCGRCWAAPGCRRGPARRDADQRSGLALGLLRQPAGRGAGRGGGPRDGGHVATIKRPEHGRARGADRHRRWPSATG
jgi:hypothetical protein